MFSFSTATTVTTQDMHDTFCSTEQDDTLYSPEPEKADHAESVGDTNRGAERSISFGGTVSTGNTHTLERLHCFIFCFINCNFRGKRSLADFDII